MTNSEPLLSIRGLCKSYGPVRVLADVSFDLNRGEVHALVGENGAGKSTFSQVIAGLTPPDAGEMRLGGKRYSPRDKRQAARRGVRMVMQELNLVGTLTVAESIFIENLPHRWGWIDRAQMRELAGGALRRVGLSQVDPDQRVSHLGVGQQQLVEIAAGLSHRCDLLILDEPTAALTDPEIEHLFNRLAELKQAGVAILYISHRMEEIRRIADRISVLRDGRMVATHGVDEITLEEIVRLMVGRELEQGMERSPRRTGGVALRVVGLRRPPLVNDVNFEVRWGEVLGFAGLMGSGRTETMRAVFGAERVDGGEIFLGEGTEPVRICSPRDAVRHGMALLTENRKEEGLLLPLTLRANTTLAGLAELANPIGWIDARAEQEESMRWVENLRIRCRGTEQTMAELSGGNQQKVLLARWMLRDCDILIFDEPTRGIDVGARFEIHRLLDKLAAEGKAIIVVSSDLKELMDVSDRIAVMSAGRLAATFARGEWTQDAIMSAALSGYLVKDQA